jgi:hypothetical protein
MPEVSAKAQTAFALVAAEAQRLGLPTLGKPHLFIALTRLEGIEASVLGTLSISGTIIPCAVKSLTIMVKEKQAAGELHAARSRATTI